MSDASTATASSAGYDVARIRADFPILSRQVNGHPLVYLDNAATAQKPNAVIDAVADFYRTINANIHRGVHTLSVEATHAYEQARGKAQRFLGAERVEELVFVRGATEAMNLVAQTWGRANLGPGDAILVSHLEHHSNIVPWQLLCEQTGARLLVAPINDAGAVIMEEYERLLGDGVKLVAAAHISNALGTINPVKDMVRLAHEAGALIMLDGAQAAPHLAIDVRDIGCDFYAITGHKMFGPTGIGVLYARYDLLDAMPPYEGGGEMIDTVTFEGSTWNDVPHKFEAGTPNIAGAVGLGAAIDYLNAIGLDAIAAYEHDLLAYATEKLLVIPGLRLIGTAEHKASILSFVIEDVHAYDIGSILDQEGIAVRTGHHCAEPVMDRYGVEGTVRASLALYNTRAEIDALVDGLAKVRRMFGLSD